MIRNTHSRIFALIYLGSDKDFEGFTEKYKVMLNEWGIDKEETDAWSNFVSFPVVAFDEAGHALIMGDDARLVRAQEHPGFIRVTTGAEVIPHDEARALLEDGIPVAPLPFMPRRSTN